MKKNHFSPMRRCAAILLSVCCIPWIPPSASAEVRTDDFDDFTVLEPTWQQNGSLLVPSSETTTQLPSLSDAVPNGIRGAAALPGAYSLLDDDGVCSVTSVKNQGSTGLCWAYAALGSCESNIMKQGLEIPDTWKDEKSELNLSEAALGWYPFTNHIQPGDFTSGDYVIMPDKGVSGGNPSIAGFALAAGIGTQLEQYASMTDWEQGYSEYQRYVSYYRMKSSDLLWEIDTAAESVIKGWLMDYGAVSASFYSKGTYYDNGNSSAYYQTKYSDNDADHAVLIVGWDDDYSRTNFQPGNQPERDGAWLIRNSWGDNDAYSGYFWLSYDEPSLCEAASFHMDSTTENIVRYQYDGGTSYAGVNFSAAANIFTAEKDGVLEEVMFPLSSFNPQTAAYTISVYRLDENAAVPTDGELLCTKNGTVSFGGYKNVSLADQNVVLKKGDRFAVTLALRNPQNKNESLHLTLESNVSGSGTLNRRAMILLGQSYIQNSAGGQWRDIVDLQQYTDSNGEKRYAQLGNAAIKAVVRESTDTVSRTQLETALAYSAPEAAASQTYRLAYTEARQLSADASQQEVNNAAWNLLAALEQEGVLAYPAYIYANETCLRGDTDENGEVNADDAYQALLSYALVSVGSMGTLRSAQAAAADVNTDGAINADDAYAILLYYATDSVGDTPQWDAILK